jgi:PAS domain S-box-containing protein
MNKFEDGLSDTAARTRSEAQIETLREQGGVFVEAVRLTRMPMIVTDATLPNNPIIFANHAFIRLSGYTFDELMGQEPHFMNGPATDPEAVRDYEEAMDQGQDANVEVLQYKKDATPFRAMLFASPLLDEQGAIRHHFLSYLDVTRRYEAEQDLQLLTQQLENKVATRTRELQEANRVLEDLLSEREMLLAEVNHRAKNSLAIAAALLGVQARRQEDPQVKALFREAQDRLGAMARVHDLLSKSESSQKVKLSRYIHDLCGALKPITETESGIELAVKTEAGTLVHADVAIPLGIIATELITNSVKYAFPPPASGIITVTTRCVGSDEVEIVVSDNGKGMGESRDGSLGFGLIETLVRKIGGEMTVQSAKGVTVTILFPNSRGSQ